MTLLRNLVTLLRNLVTLLSNLVTLLRNLVTLLHNLVTIATYISVTESHWGEQPQYHLMLIAIESPNELSDNELDCIVNVWNEKP